MGKITLYYTCSFSIKLNLIQNTNVLSKRKEKKITEKQKRPVTFIHICIRMFPQNGPYKGQAV